LPSRLRRQWHGSSSAAGRLVQAFDDVTGDLALAHDHIVGAERR
jgi:hypothetical protein